MVGDSCLHWSRVDLDAILFSGGFGSGLGLDKQNVGYSSAVAILVVMQRDLLDRANGFSKVLLFTVRVSSHVRAARPSTKTVSCEPCPD